MSFTWRKRYPKKTATNSAIGKICAGAILDVADDLSNVGFFLTLEDDTCLLDELANFRAVIWLSWHALALK